LGLLSWVLGVRDTAVHGADRGALRLVKVPHTLYALFRINDINLVTFSDRLDGAFWLASSTSNALFCDLIGHLVHLLKVSSVISSLD
jgi:hypothetical protein